MLYNNINYINGLLDNFRQVEMQKILNDFYDNQGKAERIKRTPLPSQYAAVGFTFVCIFHRFVSVQHGFRICKNRYFRHLAFRTIRSINRLDFRDDGTRRRLHRKPFRRPKQRCSHEQYL